MSDVSTDTRFAALREARCANFPAFDCFGRNDQGYDGGGPDGMGYEDDSDYDDADMALAGVPGKELVADALVVFARGWQKFDVTTAAIVFNISEGLVGQIEPEERNYIGVSPTDSPLFANAVQLISMSRYQCVPRPDLGEHRVEGMPCTVAEVAALLNVRESSVQEAVEEHYWMFLGDERDGSPTIEHEGE